MREFRVHYFDVAARLYLCIYYAYDNILYTYKHTFIGIYTHTRTETYTYVACTRGDCLVTALARCLHAAGSTLSAAQTTAIII